MHKGNGSVTIRGRIYPPRWPPMSARCWLVRSSTNSGCGRSSFRRCPCWRDWPGKPGGAPGLVAAATRGTKTYNCPQLAREGARSTPQRLENLDVGRWLAILVAFLIETAATLTDYTLEMHDRIMTQFLGQCKQSYATETENHGPALRATARRYAAVGKALITARDA